MDANLRAVSLAPQLLIPNPIPQPENLIVLQLQPLYVDPCRDKETELSRLVVPGIGVKRDDGQTSRYWVFQEEAVLKVRSWCVLSSG